MTLTEVELMGECSPLYASFALESFANTCLGLFFVYLSVLITSKGKLKTPARSSVLFLSEVVKNRYNDVMSIVNQWHSMPDLPLEKRFRFCRKVNATICQFSALVSFLAVTRWLHINNVNGFRYLGYSLTCPPMQAEILVLIAPVVPCYRFFVYLSSFITWSMLITGWIASCLEGDLWNNDIMEWAEGNFATDLELTNKGWMFVASCAGLLYLAFFQLPMVLFLYYVKGGAKAGLPEGFPRMILLVWVTWMCFPAWWSISFEGFKLINDTKLNGIGFVLLNVVSKGGFTISILRMVRLHKQKGLIPSTGSSRADWLCQLGPSGTTGTGSQSAEMQPTQSQVSGDAWFTGILNKYEQDKRLSGIEEEVGHGGSAFPMRAPARLDDQQQQAVAAHLQAVSNSGQPLAGCNTEILMDEIVKRLMTGELKLVNRGGQPRGQQQQQQSSPREYSGAGLPGDSPRNLDSSAVGA
mmetsp:Transcript_10475/g.18919  ORF Transcript_10475/g.18919 Transcript_10475/m.18919 type:complete len:468 (-) Transcript_10475:103-1506(-)